MFKMVQPNAEKNMANVLHNSPLNLSGAVFRVRVRCGFLVRLRSQQVENHWQKLDEAAAESGFSSGSPLFSIAPQDIQQYVCGNILPD